MMAPNLPKPKVDGRKKDWEPIFMPKQYVKEHEALSTEVYKLEEL